VGENRPGKGKNPDTSLRMTSTHLPNRKTQIVKLYDHPGKRPQRPTVREEGTAREGWAYKGKRQMTYPRKGDEKRARVKNKVRKEKELFRRR